MSFRFYCPIPNFQKSAECLDTPRLGKQRMNLNKCIEYLEKGGTLELWSGYENALKELYNCMVREWIRRGYVNNFELREVGEIIYPPWFGKSEYHLRQQSYLMQQFPEHYEKYFPNVPLNLYYWPPKDILYHASN